MRSGLFMFPFVCHVAHEDPDQEVFRHLVPPWVANQYDLRVKQLIEVLSGVSAHELSVLLYITINSLVHQDGLEWNPSFGP